MAKYGLAQFDLSDIAEAAGHGELHLTLPRWTFRQDINYRLIKAMKEAAESATEQNVREALLLASKLVYDHLRNTIKIGIF